MLDPKKLSREQARVLQSATQRGEQVALSDATFVEIAMLVTEGKLNLKIGLLEFLESIEDDPAFLILPVTAEIAAEAGALHMLRDPSDRVIAATARVHGLRLVTSDQRIIESNLVSTIE